MIISRYTQTFFQANTYVIVPDPPQQAQQQVKTHEIPDTNARGAVVVDPGAGSAGWVRDELERLGVELRAVLLTHGHADHVWDVAAVAGECPVYIPAPDLYRLDNPLEHLSLPGTELGFQRMGASSTWVRPSTVLPLPSEMFSSSVELIPGLWMRGIATPGHTEGSSVFLIEGTCDQAFSESLVCSTPRTFMLSGDVIFAGSVGRTDLPGGDPREMEASLRFLVNVIKPNVDILPGHGVHTNMFHETRHNPYLAAAMS